MKIDFEKMDGLVPAIIQDATTKNVLMLGFMNEEAYKKTIETGHVTFWSRSRQTLWTKGETSGHFLNLVSIKNDCDNDTLLVRVNPVGPTCHTGTDTCWGEDNETSPILFLTELQDFIDKRKKEMPEGSYTTSLFLAAFFVPVGVVAFLQFCCDILDAESFGGKHDEEMVEQV